MQYNLFDTKVHNYNPMRDLVEAQKLAQGIQPQVPLLQDVQAPIDVSFGETLSSSLGYTYSPIIDFISNTIKFGEEDRDQNYNPFDDMKGFEGYEDTLKDAVNEEHMNVLKQQLRENIARRNVLANASIGKQIVAGIFDPLNLVALPFGGIGKTVLTSAGRTGASVGVFSAGVEAIRFPFDPLATPDEVAGNIAIATIGGAILGGAIGTVNKVRLRNATKEIEREIKDFNELSDTIDTVNKARENADPKVRPLAKAEQKNLEGEQKELPNSLGELQSLKERLKKNPKIFVDSTQAMSVRNKFKDNNRQLKNRKDLINKLVNINKGLTNKAKNIVKFLEGIKSTRDKYAAPLLKIKEDLIAQSKGEKGFNIGLSKGQIEFLKKIKDQEKQLFLTKKQTAMIKKQIKEVENAQVRIEKNKANLLNKQKGTKDIISEDKVKELQAENKILNEQIRANNNLDTVIKQESAMQDEIAKVNQELTIRRTEDEALLDADGVPIDKYKLQPNWYTDKALVTPMKKAFQSELPLTIKRNFSKLANDAGLTQIAHKLGDTLGLSVYTRAAVRNGEYVKAHDKLRQLYAEHTGKDRVILDYDFQKKGYHEWLEDTYSRVLKQEPLSELDKKVKTIVDDFMNTWEKRLRDQGLIGTTENLTARIVQENIRIQNYVKKLRQLLDPEGKPLTVTKQAIELEKGFIAFARGEDVDITALNKSLDQLEKYKILGINKGRTNIYKTDVVGEIRKIQDDLKQLKENLQVSKQSKVKPNNEEFLDTGILLLSKLIVQILKEFYMSGILTILPYLEKIKMVTWKELKH